MAANTTPRFTGKANPQWATVATTANTSKDLTSGTNYLIYTAPTDGALVDGVLCVPFGTNVATVARLFLNNGDTTATAANNTQIGQISLPATTNTETAALPVFILPIPRMLQDIPAGYKLYITLGTAVSAGWQFTAMASKWSTT